MPRDISGLKFGKLTAIKLIRTEKTKYNYRYIWLFKCNCGKEKEINAPSVIHGHISSCGCLMYQYDCGNKSYLWKGCGDISARFYHSIKGNARHREIEFDLRIEDIWELFLKQNKRCYFSGEELLFGNMTRNQSLTTASLDRINSSGAYNNENIRWVHKAINGMKWDLSDEKFIYYCQLIVNPMRDKTPSGIEDGNFINTGSWNGYKNISRTYWSLVLTHAKNKKIPVDIDMRYAWNLFEKQNGHCALSGLPLCWGYKSIQTASLDRIDSKKGYIFGNIQWLHKDINRKLKREMPEENLKKWCGLVCSHVKKNS